MIKVVWARPKFVNAATISRAILSYDNMQEVIVHTSQHFDANMSEIFFIELEINKSSHNLQINSTVPRCYDLVNTESESDVLNAYDKLKSRSSSFDNKLYGEGNSAQKIIEKLISYPM